jgi:nucleoid-associated protein EbfC
VSGPGDLSDLFSQMGMLREQLAQAQAEGAGVEAEGSAGQGAVRVRVRGDFEFTGVTIDPALIAEGDVSLIEDLVLAAVHDAVGALASARQRALGAAATNALSNLLGGIGGASLEDDSSDDQAT